MEYYSVSAILAENQKIPCTFNIDVPGLGHLQGTNDKDISSGSTVQLPLWLGLALADSDRNLVRVNFPKAYSTRVRNALTASPHALNLRNIGGSAGYFFDIGTRLLEVFDDPELKQLLHHSFQSRLPQVIDQCLQENAPDASEFVSGLDEWERQVFVKGQNSHLDTKDWLESRKTSARH